MKKGEEWHRFLSSAVAECFDGIAVADLDYKLMYVNPAWAKMHGYNSVDEANGKYMNRGHGPEQNETGVELFMQVVKVKGKNTGEMRHFPQNNEAFTFVKTSLGKSPHSEYDSHGSTSLPF